MDPGRIIEAADARGMVVLVGCLYHGDSRGWWRHWTQADAERAVARTVAWLQNNNYRNVFVDVNNEHMAPFDDSKLIAAAKTVDSSYVVGTSGKVTPPNADLSLHHGSPNIAGKYYIETEGTGGDYWGAYSKQPGRYNYIHIGVYTDAMKREMLRRTDAFLDRGQGYLFASTWLQCVPPDGPNHAPGGMGTPDDPGVRWWLEHVRSRVGSYRPAAAPTGFVLEGMRPWPLTAHVFRENGIDNHWNGGGVWQAPWRLADDFHVYGMASTARDAREDHLAAPPRDREELGGIGGIEVEGLTLGADRHRVHPSQD